MNQHIDLSRHELVDFALQRNEGILSANQALTVITGPRTGRSPKDRFIVKDSITADTVDWGNINQPFDAEKFAALWQKVYGHIMAHEHFISHLQVGADPQYALGVKVITEHAWQNLFTQNLFIRPEKAAIETEWVLLSAPTFIADPEKDGTNSDAAIILNFTQKRILICGTHYAGEMKKAMFSVLNFMLPTQNVLPMHCAANVGKNGKTALFFGLSGTGKTTLSADPERFLIGDDEHGWSENGIFNFEGGCYAKCIDLSKEKEPVIWDAIRFGSIMENVVLDAASNHPVYTDSTLTQNTRAAYPLEHIEMRVNENRAGHPESVLFLTCDLFGVLPPVSILNNEQAAYHFLSGYTALVGSTEVGQTESIKTTFSTCFGAPFFPRPAAVYANLLIKRLLQTNANVYLINTGWTGGAYGAGGHRFAIPVTRAIVSAVLNNKIDHNHTETLPGFNLVIPKHIDGIDSTLLNPQLGWKDKQAYQTQLQHLIHLFKTNFKKFGNCDPAIIAAGPSET